VASRARRRRNEEPAHERYGDGVVARNRRAHFDFELDERLEAGLVLVGSEVKALRQGHADLGDAWCRIDGRQAFVNALSIPVLPEAAVKHEPKRSRKLLLHRHEIERLARALEREGMTAVVTRLYFRGGRAKIEIALARGKKKYDKRETIRRREADREAAAAIARAHRG
jgi:SsrA-binding protein